MRALATLGSIVLLLGLYGLYGWVLVPKVLPLPVESPISELVLHQPKIAHDESKPYHFLLPEKEWERNPETELHYLKFGETVLLFGKDTPNGKILKLEPCTVLMIQGIDDPDLTEEQVKDRLRQAVVLRTPLYAEIEFNKDFNLNDLESLVIVGGRLIGKVTVESDMKLTGPGDDICLETEDISISLANPAVTQISTIKDVRFRYGYHNGEGSMLNLELTAVNPKNPKSEKQLSRLQFEKLKRLQLIFPENSELAPKVVADASGQLLQGKRILPTGPATFLDVKCQRQFSFYSQQPAGSWIARFQGSVDIDRTTPDGLTDQLDAEDVSIVFQEKKPTPATAPAKSTAKTAEKDKIGGKMGDLEPVLFKALGRLAQGNQPNVPARLTSKRNGGVLMRGDQLLYDLRKNLLTLETQTAPGASPEVEIVLEDRYHIRGQKGFEYLMGPQGELGRLVSLGKGSLTGNFGEPDRPRNLFLSWNQMQIMPDPEKKDLITLKLWNGIAANLEGFGKMTAGRLDLWCQSTPRDKTKPAATTPPRSADSQGALPGMGGSGDVMAMAEKSQLRPVDAVVSDNVRFENDSGVCNVNRLDVIFASSETLPSTALYRNVPDGGRTRLVRLVQHVQSKDPQREVLAASAPASPSIPLYEAKPNEPVASRAPTRGAAPVSKPAATRSLLGMQSGNTPARYEITGNVMQMKVDETGKGEARVEALKIEGDVRVIETVLDRTQGDMIEIQGEEIRVWNPSTDATQVQIVGHPRRDAEFKGRGVRMIAREINISRPENKIWSNGMGRLLISSDKTNRATAPNGSPQSAPAELTPMTLTPLKSLASGGRNADSPLVVEWNERMVFDGKTILFGDHKKAGSRVQTIFQDKNIWCNVMEIHLNRLVNFFEKEDPGLVPPEADTIRCLHEVHVRIRETDEAGQLKSINEARFETLTYRVKMNYFVATALERGELRRTFLGSEKGLGESKLKLPVSASPKTSQNGTGESLSFLSVWFYQDMHGTLQPNYLDVEINGDVQTAYCSVESWDDIIRLDNIKAALQRGYILECEKLRLLQMPDPMNPKQGAVELRAQENAKIEGGQIYGSAREIKYQQARNLVIFEGHAKIHAYDDGKPMGFAADAIEYNTETGAYQARQSSGVIIGP